VATLYRLISNPHTLYKSLAVSLRFEDELDFSFVCRRSFVVFPKYNSLRHFLNFILRGTPSTSLHLYVGHPTVEASILFLLSLVSPSHSSQFLWVRTTQSTLNCNVPDQQWRFCVFQCELLCSVQNRTRSQAAFMAK
jgi:hypothetical protein